jgi:hypothetical protein
VRGKVHRSEHGGPEEADHTINDPRATEALIDKGYAEALAKIASPPRAFDYAAFIDELRPLIQLAQEFPPDATSANSPAFKRWRHEVSDLIHRIQRQRYSVNCQVENRQFMITSYGSSTPTQHRRQFEEDLVDTLTELDVLVKNFDKYGDPKTSAKLVVDSTKQPVRRPLEVATTETNPNAQSTVPEPLQMKWPQKVTAAWLWKHMPLSGYAALSGAFLAGVAAGNWEPIKQLFLIAVKRFGG